MGCSSSKVVVKNKKATINQVVQTRVGVKKTAININNRKSVIFNDKAVTRHSQLKVTTNSGPVISIYALNAQANKITKYFKNQLKPSQNSIFIDPLFKPNTDSILGIDEEGNYTDPIEERRESYMESLDLDLDQVKWCRLHEIFKDRVFTVFDSSISTSDVSQGNIGNCYFISALAALASIPQQIINIFRTLKVNHNGFYEVILRLNGIWKVVVIDDRFPCYKHNNQPVFAQPNGAEVWPMILEKAWAKVNHGYLNIVSGRATEVLNCMTCFPVETVQHEEDSRTKILLWKKIEASVGKECFISCCSDPEKVDEECGLEPGHAYTVLATASGSIGGVQIKLLLMRNPWGSRDWRGAWSEESGDWTEEAKHLLGFKQPDKGSFWISYEDYLKYFDMAEFCTPFANLNYKIITVPKNLLHKPVIFTIKTSTNHLAIQLFKKNYRFNRSIEEDLELNVNMILVQEKAITLENTDKWEFYQSANDADSNPLMEADLTAGRYKLIVLTDYLNSNIDKERKYSVGFSGTADFSVSLTGADEEYELVSSIVRTQIMKASNTVSLKRQISRQGTEFDKTSLCYFYYMNSSDAYQELEITPKSVNFSLFKGFKNGFTKKVFIKPEEDFLLLGNRVDYYEEYDFHVEFKTSTRKRLKHYEKTRLRKESEFSFQEEDSEEESENEECEYDFVYSKVDQSKLADLDEMFRVANRKDILEASKANPRKMEEIMKMPERERNKDLVFKSDFKTEVGTYFGEWCAKKNVMHGRGILELFDGEMLVGWFENGKPDGAVRRINKEGNEIEVLYSDGNAIEDK